MTFEPVELLVVDDTPSKSPVPAVVVRVFDERGVTFLTAGVTGEDGRAGLLLPAPASYQARFYRFQTVFRQPQRLDISLGPETNAFVIVAHVFSPPEAVDPRLCRSSGFFRDLSGAPTTNVAFHIFPKSHPTLIDQSAVLPGRLHVRTDKNGYAEVDLVRFARYEIVVEGFEDLQRIIEVPDRPSANLPDLLFPVVSEVRFEPAGPWSVGVGTTEELTVTPTVLASDGRELVGTALEDVLWSTLHPSIAVVIPSNERLVLRGLQPGVTELVVSRKDASVIQIPDRPIRGARVPIAVA
jgi:hypothetical protein